MPFFSLNEIYIFICILLQDDDARCKNPSKIWKLFLLNPVHSWKNFYGQAVGFYRKIFSHLTGEEMTKNVDFYNFTYTIYKVVKFFANKVSSITALGAVIYSLFLTYTTSFLYGSAVKIRKVSMLSTVSENGEERERPTTTLYTFIFFADKLTKLVKIIELRLKENDGKSGKELSAKSLSFVFVIAKKIAFNSGGELPYG